jgi:cytochrome c
MMSGLINMAAAGLALSPSGAEPPADQHAQPIQVATTGSGGAVMTFSEAERAALADRVAMADAAAGEDVAQMCTACHRLDEGGQPIVGPTLFGVVGRPAAAAEGYRYSPAMAGFAEQGGRWELAELDAYLERPREVVPGTTKAFIGLTDADQRLALLAYLQTLQ